MKYAISIVAICLFAFIISSKFTCCDQQYNDNKLILNDFVRRWGALELSYKYDIYSLRSKLSKSL